MNINNYQKVKILMIACGIHYGWKKNQHYLNPKSYRFTECENKMLNLSRNFLLHSDQLTHHSNDYPYLSLIAKQFSENQLTTQNSSQIKVEDQLPLAKAIQGVAMKLSETALQILTIPFQANFIASDSSDIVNVIQESSFQESHEAQEEVEKSLLLTSIKTKGICLPREFYSSIIHAKFCPPTNPIFDVRDWASHFEVSQGLYDTVPTEKIWENKVTSNSIVNIQNIMVVASGLKLLHHLYSKWKSATTSAQRDYTVISREIVHPANILAQIAQPRITQVAQLLAIEDFSLGEKENVQEEPILAFSIVKVGFMSLPKELIQHIWSFLSDIEKTHFLNTRKDYSSFMFEYMLSELAQMNQVKPQGLLMQQRLLRGILHLNLVVLGKSKPSVEYFLPFRNITARMKSENIVFADFNHLLVDDNDIEALATQLPNLTQLDLARCKRITDATLAILTTSFVKLKYLNLFGCSGVTTEAFVKFCQTRKDVKHHLSPANTETISTDFASQVVAFRQFDLDASKLYPEALIAAQQLDVNGTKTSQAWIEKLKAEDKG